MEIAERLHALALEAYDRMIGLELGELSVDGCITKAPCGGEAAGRSAVDRGKQGLKRSVATEARGIPLGMVSAGANRHDSPLLMPRRCGPLACPAGRRDPSPHVERPTVRVLSKADRPP